MKKSNVKKYEEPIMEVSFFDVVETVIASTLEWQEFQDTEGDVGNWNDWVQ